LNVIEAFSQDELRFIVDKLGDDEDKANDFEEDK